MSSPWCCSKMFASRQGDAAEQPDKFVARRYVRLRIHAIRQSSVPNNPEPIMCLSCFFQCNRHLREEIFLALRSNRLLDVGADRCAGANELFRQHPLPLFQLETTASFDYADCKGKTLF